MYKLFKLRFLVFILVSCFCCINLAFTSYINARINNNLVVGPKPVVSCTVGECEPAHISSMLGSCIGHINLNVSATDNCSSQDKLIWEYKIDAFNDGVGIHNVYDFRVGALSKKAILLGDTVEYSHNPYADDRYFPFDASGNYPFGVHKICWFIKNECGDVGVCCTLFEIKDCKAPSPKCITKSQ